MFVTKSMTRDVITLSPDDSILKARDLMQVHRIRHLPVVSEDYLLVGMVTDRDLRSAAPSSLFKGECTAEEQAALATFRVSEMMTSNLVTLSFSDTLQDALLLIQKRKFGALPVVDEEGRLAGILSVRDLLRAFVNVLGIGEPGTLLCIVVPDEFGQMKRIVDTIYEARVSTGSIVVARHWEEGKRVVFPYVFSINTAALKKRFKEKGYTLLDPLQWSIDERQKSE
ncbi:CBS and ACT domain-containing protein [Thermodesulfobacteriota bacterium]